MNDGNTLASALADAGSSEADRRKIADLEARLAQYEGERVERPDFGGEAPRYRANSPIFLEDDTYHPQGTEINYYGTPNTEMVPLNEPARRKMQEVLDGMTAGARALAELRGRPFTGLVTDKGHNIAMSLHDERANPGQLPYIAMPIDVGEPPVMPHTPEAQAKRAPGRQRKDALVAGTTAPPKPAARGPEAVDILGRGYTQTGARSAG